MCVQIYIYIYIYIYTSLYTHVSLTATDASATDLSSATTPSDRALISSPANDNNDSNSNINTTKC